VSCEWFFPLFPWLAVSLFADSARALRLWDPKGAFWGSLIFIFQGSWLPPGYRNVNNLPSCPLLSPIFLSKIDLKAWLDSLCFCQEYFIDEVYFVMHYTKCHPMSGCHFYNNIQRGIVCYLHSFNGCIYYWSLSETIVSWSQRGLEGGDCKSGCVLKVGFFLLSY
jgi:hypothetical protein